MNFLSLLVVLFCCGGLDVQAQSNRRRVVQCRPSMVCPLTFQEVCGTDGRTYRNRCLLLRQRCTSGGLLGLAYLGPCGRGRLCNQRCPLIYQPICGDDGKTYASDCLLKVTNCLYLKSVRKLQEGKCQSVGTLQCKDKNCSNTRSELCGNNGKTYKSDCEFQKAKCDDTTNSLRIVKRGSCGQCKRTCSFVYQPVCGTDRKTYSNKCLLNAVTCKNPEIIIKHTGSCGTCMYKCSPKRDPICGANGQTYQNQCELDRYNCENKRNIVSKKHDGECDACAPKCANRKKAVCGSDMMTYYNACYLRRSTCQKGISDVYKLYDGACHKCGPECPKTDNPVCASNQKTYDNICAMKRESCLKKLKNVLKVYNGQCQRSCSLNCANSYQPVCASNGVTYRNYCMLKEAACRAGNTFRKGSNGRCKTIGGSECVRHCSQDISYVCATDKKTYINECILSIKTCASGGRVTKAYQGRCKKTQANECSNVQYPRYCLRKSYIYYYDRQSNQCKHTYQCKADVNSFNNRETCKKTCVKSCSKHCPRSRYRVCASNGKTYESKCHLEVVTCQTNGSVQFSYHGVCGGQQN